MMRNAFPLMWPHNRSRTAASSDGQSGHYSAALAKLRKLVIALEASTDEDISLPVLSSNVRYGKLESNDAGVALWFKVEEAQYCITADAYDDASANLAIVRYIVESALHMQLQGVLLLDVLEEHSIRTVSRAAEVAALDDLVLTASQTRTEIRAAYAEAAKMAHPDAGGSREEWDRVAAAYERAKERLAHLPEPPANTLFDDSQLVDLDSFIRSEVREQP